jgi:hypothetical protein
MSLKWMIGKKVAEVAVRSFKNLDGTIYHSPVITFEDRSKISFRPKKSGVKSMVARPKK